ncbi:hypothetical protein Taro_005519 [Colocasia esculenta]|uniref:Alcohol dehydrogenase-like N-terminal domain-containing protein n=1 Tax=Colocasia esculenta TaxID=4460 RepID=A0A843TQ37_COLES|nr:hypothetical protein [Colocasia esculenta]
MVMETVEEVSLGKPIRCRAAVCRGAGQPLQMEEVVVAAPGPWQVRIKIICSSLCHSDLTFWRMKDFPGVFPRIFGHEAVGVVESVGEGVEEVGPGDVVLPTFLGNCGACADCTSQRSNMCAIGFHLPPGLPRGAPSPFTSAADGSVIHNFLAVSSFVEYTVVDVAYVTRVDPAIPPEKACLLSCGVSTGVGAAWKVAAVEEGSTVVVFGLGAVGLAVAEGARLRGAAKIIGVDLNPDKFEIEPPALSFRVRPGVADRRFQLLRQVERQSASPSSRQSASASSGCSHRVRLVRFVAACSSPAF